MPAKEQPCLIYLKRGEADERTSIKRDRLVGPDHPVAKPMNQPLGQRLGGFPRRSLEQSQERRQRIQLAVWQQYRKDRKPLRIGVRSEVTAERDLCLCANPPPHP